MGNGGDGLVEWLPILECRDHAVREEIACGAVVTREGGVDVTAASGHEQRHDVVAELRPDAF